MKAARRAEIERRCMLLKPPLTPGVLAHMPSFQAALQISQPITDGSWEVLQPGLLSQREQAEQREGDRLAQIRVAQDRRYERQYQHPTVESTSKDLVDRGWDDFQAPLRARIGGYADETIHNGWNGGKKVTHETSPKFAADVLIYVRKRFYAEIAKDEAAMRATGREPEADPPDGPYLRKLVLENMKWVFDTKIKPYTEPYRKELFLCNDPYCPTYSKWYGFEGVIQHFAAKHTNSLSLGSVVVHWKAEWPEYPPFNPDPTTASTHYYNAAPSASAPYAGNGSILQQGYVHSGYQSASVPTPMPGRMATPMQNPLPAPTQNPLYAPNGFSESQGSNFRPPQFVDEYSGHRNGPYLPNQPNQDTPLGYQVQQYPTPAFTNGVYSQTSQDYSQQGYNVPYAAPSQPTYSSSNQGPPYSAPVPPFVKQETYVPPDTHNSSSYSQSLPFAPDAVVVQPAQKSEEYKTQLQEVARSVRDTWNGINSMKEIPGSVKVYTIIHHLLVRSRASYLDDPTLPMIKDGLSNNKEMRPARNINGLLCRACILGLIGTKPNLPRKHFSFPQLLNHFHTIHEQSASKNSNRHFPDWKSDMVELPDISKLSSIFHEFRKDDQRQNLVMEAISRLIPATVPEDGRQHSVKDYAESNGGSYNGLAQSQDNHKRYYAGEASPEPPKIRSSSYYPGEYDPRNPQELPFDSRPASRIPPSREEHSRQHQYEDSPRGYRVVRPEQDPGNTTYQDRRGISYAEHELRPPPVLERRHGTYEHSAMRDEATIDADRQDRYREVDGSSARHRPVPLTYNPYTPQDAADVSRQQRLHNSESYQRNQQNTPPVMDAAARDRIFEVVARISQQAQRAHERLPRQEMPTETGSEDGEVRVIPSVMQQGGHSQHRSEPEASNATERFLSSFRPGDPPRDDLSRVERQKGVSYLRSQEYEQGDSNGHVYRPLEEPSRRARDGSDSHPGQASRDLGEPIRRDTHGTTHPSYEAPPSAQVRPYAYEARQDAPGSGLTREQSPEFVDRRYKINDAVYRDERQISQGAYRTPSRFARYKSAQLEIGRARSRSPAYVNKPGGQMGYQSERSPVGPPMQPDPIYRARTPQAAVEDFSYERPPRQGYYRVYADEPRPRSPEAYELVRVTDAQGEYVIRRPIDRGLYARYGDERYSRRPVYESRPVHEARVPIQRSAEPQIDEYDPRHPEPPPVATVRQRAEY